MSAHSHSNTLGPRGRTLRGRSDAARSAEPVLEAPRALILAQPFFNGMKAEHLQTLADSATETEFVAGQFLFRESDTANRLYLIECGKVAVELERRDNEPILLQTLGPGQEVGWSWMLPPYHEQFTARALEATKVIFFHGTRLREQCAADHDLGYELMSRMAVVMLHRIQATRRQLLAAHVGW